MTRAVILMVIVTACGASAPRLFAHGPQDLPNNQYTQREADTIGARLFKAIVGREGGGTGPRDAADQIMDGHLKAQVEAMFDSAEFREKSSTLTPTEILDQIYQGLLDRKVDDAGVRTYLREIEQRKGAVVVLKIINDTEFETRILGLPARSSRAGSGTSRAGSSTEANLMRAAEACQAEVVRQLRADAGRPVLVRFQGMNPGSSSWGGATIRGTAIDALDQNRRISYRCDMDRRSFAPTRASYSFDDGQRDWDYPLPSVRACQDAVRAQINRERGRRDLEFESAGVSEWNSGLEHVYGRGRERSNSGAVFEYQCDIERGRVTMADFQLIR